MCTLCTVMPAPRSEVLSSPAPIVTRASTASPASILSGSAWAELGLRPMLRLPRVQGRIAIFTPSTDVGTPKYPSEVGSLVDSGVASPASVRRFSVGWHFNSQQLSSCSSSGRQMALHTFHQPKLFVTGSQDNPEHLIAVGECHARSAHAVRSFGCRQILEPYFWPPFTSFWFCTRVFLASQAFRMWHI